MAVASSRSASIGLVIGCIIFGLGSLIVAHVDIGGWAMSFWRLAISGVIFAILAKLTGQRLPRSRRAIFMAYCQGHFGFGFGVMAREHLCGRPWYLNLAQQFTNFLFSSDRLFILQRAPIHLAAGQFVSGHVGRGNDWKS